MPDKGFSEDTVRFLRRISLLAGIVCIAASVVAKAAGISIGGGITVNQFLFFFTGAVLITASILGRSFPVWYKKTGVLFLNTVAALLVLELVSIVLVKVINREQLRIMERKVEEGGLLEPARNIPEGIFAPYVMWRANPMCSTDTLTVGESGYRHTPGTYTPPDTVSTDEYLTVFLLGGSAMWGTGVGDENTIPAHLQNYLEDQLDVPVQMINLGQPAFNSTQELIELMIQLRNGIIPDVVVFYDGFNDIWAAYETGSAGALFGEAEIESRYTRDPGESLQASPVLSLLQQTNTWMLVSSLKARFSSEESTEFQRDIYSDKGIAADSLAQQVVELYRSNIQMAVHLGHQYGFQVAAVWQPTVWYGEKPLSEHEQRIYDSSIYLAGARGTSAFLDLYHPAYRLFEESLERDTDGVFFSYADVFQGNGNTVYTDFSGVHLTGIGNRIIADSLSVMILRGMTSPL